eukprot:COSAG06_NODE_1672_length_8747_cov_27.533418_3_plen_216_part_00
MALPSTRHTSAHLSRSASVPELAVLVPQFSHTLCVLRLTAPWALPHAPCSTNASCALSACRSRPAWCRSPHTSCLFGRAGTEPRPLPQSSATPSLLALCRCAETGELSATALSHFFYRHAGRAANRSSNTPLPRTARAVVRPNPTPSTLTNVATFGTLDEFRSARNLPSVIQRTFRKIRRGGKIHRCDRLATFLTCRGRWSTRSIWGRGNGQQEM